MKFLLVALCTVGVVALVSAQGRPRGPPPGHGQPPQNSEQARKAEEMTRKCQAKESATEADMREFSQQRKPSTKTGKCLHACLMESIGLIENGMLSVENSVRFMSQMSQGNNELVKIIEEISKGCEQMKDEDRCELAFKIMTCTEEGIRMRQDELRKYMPRQPPPPQQHQQHQQQ